MEMMKRLFIVAAYASVLPLCIACGDRLTQIAQASSDQNLSLLIKPNQFRDNFSSSNIAFASQAFSSSSAVEAKNDVFSSANPVDKFLVVPRDRDGSLVFRPVAQFVEGNVVRIAK